MYRLRPLQKFKEKLKLSAKMLVFLIALLASLTKVQAQVAVTVTNPTNATPNLAASYSSLASAITALNSVATFSGQVTLTCATGGTETAPAGGYSISFTGATTLSNNVIIDGATSTITAASAPTAGSRTDAIFKIIGCDFVTIQNFTMTENSANTTEGAITAQRMTEFGVALFASSATNGAQNNTIENNTITLSSSVAYRNAIGIFSTCASSSTNGAQVASSIAGTNSNNKFYRNIISGVAHGLYFIAPPQTATIFESGNDIGGSSALTGNTITYGRSNTAGDLGFTSYSGTTPAGIYFRNVQGNSARYNTISNQSGLTLTSAGIIVANGTAPVGTTYTTNFSNNTITITQTASVAISGIDFGSGLATGTITANDNTITINHTVIAANSAAIIGLKANYTAASSTVNSNTVTINSNTNYGSTLSNTGAHTGITLPGGTTGTPTVTCQLNTVSLNRNTTIASTITGTVSGTWTGIQATTAASNMTIGSSGNANSVSFQDNPGGAGTSTISAANYFINAGAGHGTLRVRYNNLQSTGTHLRGTGTTYGVSHGGTMTAGLEVTNNTINVNRSNGASGTFYGDYSCSSTGVLAGGYNINNNSITYVAGATGAAYGIFSCDGGVPVKSYNNNNITISGAGTGVYGIFVGYGPITSTGNTFNLTSSNVSSPLIYGFYGTGGGTVSYSVYSNTFTNLSATGTSTNGPTIGAIYLLGGVTNSIYNNVISNISTAAGAGNATIMGIWVSAGTTNNIYRNKIYDLSTACTGVTTTIQGIRVTGGTTNNIYNNIVSQTNALIGVTNPNAVIGINIASSTASSANNVYYNTVYLTSTSTGADFGASGIWHTSNATSTTAALDLRNNVIINSISPIGTGTSYAIRRTSTALNNFASTSNNNLFYCTTGIFNDGTNTDATVSDYKSRVNPRESFSVSENVNFVNSNSPLTTQFLEPDPATPTQIESGAVAILTYTNDYYTDGSRSSYPLASQNYGGGSAPDMGAFELDLSPADLSGPSITYTAVPNTTSTTAVTLVATISDASGVPTSGTGLPVLYWKTSTVGTYTAVTGTFLSGNNFSFSFGGGSANDIIQYFIAAQDNAGNVTISPSTGSSGPTINPPSVSTSPTVPAYYTILTPWTGSYVIGGTNAGLAAGADYISISEAFADVTQGQIKSIYILSGGTGYAAAPALTITGGGGSGATATCTIDATTGAINSVTITSAGTGYTSAPTVSIGGTPVTPGNLIANVASGRALGGATSLELSSNYNSTFENSFPINIVAIPGASATNTLTIKPATGVTATISATVNTGSIIKIHGGDFIIIDGSNNGTTSRNLTIRNNTATTTGNAVVWIASPSLGNGSNYNTIKNCIIEGNSGTTTMMGMFIGGNATIATTAAGTERNNFNTITNNLFRKTQYGLFTFGYAAAFPDSNNVISNNLFGTAVSGEGFNLEGIRIDRAVDLIISGNDVQNVRGTSTTTMYGMRLLDFKRGQCYNNKIHNMAYTGSSTGRVIGMLVLSSTYSTVGNPSSAAIYNNSVYDLTTSSTSTTWTLTGICASNGYGDMYYHNSISLTGQLNNSSAGLSAAFAIGDGSATTACTNAIVKNNAFSITGTSLGGNVWAYYTRYVTFTGASSNYNLLYAAATGGTSNVGYLNATSYATLANWQTATLVDTNSISALPLFNSATSLRPQIGSPLIGAGLPLAGYTTDLLGTSRSLTTPSIGAYEEGADGTPPTITFTALSNTTSTGSRSIDATIVDPGAIAAGLNTTTAKPIVYFKKASDANVFGVANNASGNGWKYVQTSSTSSPFTMSIDVSLLQTAPTKDDTIQYFVVAQDTVNNVGSSSLVGFEGSSVTNIITAPLSPSFYIVIGAPFTAGTYTVGAGGNYTTITSAQRDLILRGVAGPVIMELIDTAYRATTETFPLTFSGVSGVSSTNTITYQPSASATSVIIGGTSTTGIINFDNGSYYIIEGRAGGVGSTPLLTFENNSTSGYTINFINDSKYNTVTYNNINGSNNSTTGGTIRFSTTTLTSGNDSNTVSYNNIGNGITSPAVAIYGTGTLSKSNNHNFILNNNIFNWGLTSAYGVFLSLYNTDYVINGNSFYQTTPRTFTSITSAVYISNNTDGNGFTVNGNFYGGTGPNCSGTPMTLRSGANIFQGFYFSVDTMSTSNFQGNTITNILDTTTSSSTAQSLLYIVGGQVSAGNITPNNFGSQTDSTSIVFVNSYALAGTTFAAIGTSTGKTDTIRIENNLIGGITTRSTTTQGISLRGIDPAGSAGRLFINGNTIGGTIPNSMVQTSTNNLLPLINRSTSVLQGSEIKNNIIRNCLSTHTSSNIVGLSTGALINGPVSGNQIYNLTSANISITGIQIAVGSTDLNCTQNIIHTLKSSSTSAATVNGIGVNGPTTGSNSITKNIIHSLNANRDSSSLNGIGISSGTVTYANNIIRLGLDENGSDITKSHYMNGINEAGGSNNIYYNTVYVAGNGVNSGACYTYALNSSVTANTRNYRNNLFVNKRQNGTSTGKHMAIQVGGTSANPAGLTINYNDYSTISAPVGRFNLNELAAISDWRDSVGQDNNSFSEDPYFVQPTGSVSTIDLHLVTGTASLIESGGASISGISTDFDGDARPGPAGSINGGGIASDLGADEFDGSIFPLNMGAIGLISPIGTCATTNKTIVIRVKNYSLTDSIDFGASNVSVNAGATGPNPVTFTPVILSSGKLAPGATQDVTISTTYDMSSNGTYTFTGSTSLLGDANTGNDAMAPSSITIATLTAGTITSSVAQYCNSTGTPTLTTTATGGDIQWMESSVSATGPFSNVGTNSNTYTPATAIGTTMFYTALISCNSTTIAAGDTVSVYVPIITATSGGTRCGPGSVTLSATPGTGQSINWYANATGGLPLVTGSNTYSPSVTATDTFYATSLSPGSSVQALSAGATWNQYTTVGGFQATGIGSASMVFDALSDITISSLDIYPSAAIGTSFTIEVRQTNSTGTLIASYTGLTTVQNTGTPSIAETVPVNFSIPTGTNYVIGFSSNPSTWRGNVSNFPYPYLLPGYLNVQGSSFGTSPGTTLNYQYFFYNWNVMVGCESGRSAVIATVTSPPALTVSSASQQICSGLTSTSALTISSTVSDFNTYDWSPATGVSGNSTSGYLFNPSSTTTYTLTGTQTSGSLCANTASHTVTVNPLPTALVASPDPVNYCATSPAAVISVSGGLNIGNFVSGTAVTTTVANNYTPYSSNWEGARTQYLILASELQAQGVTGGNFNSLSFTVTASGAGTFAQSGFNIKLGHTAAISLSGYVTPTGGFTSVYGPVSEPAPGVGTKTHNFSTPFTWDGTSNVVIEICHDNDVNGTCTSCFSGNSTVAFTATSFNSVYGNYADNQPACGFANGTATTGTGRPNMSIGWGAPNTYTWSPTTDLFTNVGATTAYTSGNAASVYTLPTANRSYVATATNIYGCVQRDTVTVNYLTTPSAPTLSASNSISTTGFTANWATVSGATSYKLDVATDALFASMVSGYNDLTVAGLSQAVTGLTAGTTYYVRVRGVNTCGTSASSTSVSAITLSSAPVLSGTTGVSTTDMTINWTATTGAASYLLDVSTSNTFNTFVSGYNGLAVPTGTSQAVTGLTAGTRYYYRVLAVNASGNSAYSSTGDTVTLSGSATLSLTAFFEGLYLGSSTMTAAPFNSDNTLPSSIADTITVELHLANGTFDLAYSVTDTISVDGTSSISLPGAAVGNYYYIVVKHRNSVETWSADSILISSSLSYDFSSSAGQAYGSNMVDLGSGVFGIYSGDINQDGSVDFLDYPDLDLGSINGDLGYLVTDLNGDGSVDFLEYPLIDLNSINGVISMRP